MKRVVRDLHHYTVDMQMWSSDRAAHNDFVTYNVPFRVSAFTMLWSA